MPELMAALADTQGVTKMAKADGMKGWQHYDGDYPHYRRRKGTHEYLIAPHVETLRGGKPKKVRKLEDAIMEKATVERSKCQVCQKTRKPGYVRAATHTLKHSSGEEMAVCNEHADAAINGYPSYQIQGDPDWKKYPLKKSLGDLMGGTRTLGTALGIEKKKADEPLEIHREGKVSFHASKGDPRPIVARHEDHGVIATIHHDPTGKEDKIGRQPSLRSHPYGTHVLEPTGSLADEMGTERHNTAIDAMRSVAEHGNRLPSKAQIDSSLAHSEGGTDHHYGIASKYVTGSAFRAREVSNNLGRPAPDHVVQHKGWTHEYTDFRGSIEGRHIDAKGNAHYSRHPDARTGHEAHQQFEEGHGTRVPIGSGHQPHPQREYRDSSGVASHTYHAAHDGRPGFYGTHLSFFPNTSVAEAPRGDATAYGNSSSPNHDFHVSYHPTAKSHDEAHMQYLKARGVVKSADGGEVPSGESELEKALDYSNHSLQIHTVDRKGLKFAQPHCSCGWKGKDEGHAFRRGAYEEHERHVAAAESHKK